MVMFFPPTAMMPYRSAVRSSSMTALAARRSAAAPVPPVPGRLDVRRAR
jgi:hypothetical protein